MKVVTIHTITRADANGDTRSERVARYYAEAIAESDTTMVHTVMFPDGQGSTTTYWRRAAHESWVACSSVRFNTRPIEVPYDITTARRGTPDFKPETQC